MGEIRPAYIYVMGYDRGGPLKVGRAVDPAARRRELQTGSHRELKIFLAVMCGVPTMVEIERLSHLGLAKQRISGEWFDVPVETAIAAIWAAFEAFQFGAQPILAQIAYQVGLTDLIDTAHLPNDYAAYKAKEFDRARMEAAQDPIALVFE